MAEVNTTDSIPPCSHATPLLGVAVLAFALSSGACGGGGKDDSASDTDAGTGGGTTGDATGTPTTGEPMLPPGCDALVAPSADDQTALQTALIDAAEGATVCLAEGTFTLNSEVSISANKLTLKGAGRDKTILDFSAQDLGANGIKITGDGVTVTGFTVRETPGDGIRGDEVDGITYDDISVEWTAKESMENGAYGFYPVGSNNVVIRNSRVIGARDAGIYVGQSTNIIVEDNEAYDNVAGIEIENSTGATVRRNHAHDNTGGILIFNLPGLPVQDGKRTLAYDNIVENNNSANFGEPGTAVAAVPPGIGIMILAADNNELRNNTLRGNGSAGVVIVSYNEALGLKPADDPSFDAFPEGNYVHDNTFEGNGTMPDPLIMGVTGGMAVDILYDGCESADNTMMDPMLMNCVENNGAAAWIDIDLCGEFMNQSTDIATVTCTHPTLPETPGA
jgi:parallel beta-helix repeat protein